MKLKVTIDQMTQSQWETAQRKLQAEYYIPENASRVCLTLVHGEETKHVEAPVTVLTGLLLSMALAPLANTLQALAVLTPDDERLPPVEDSISSIPTRDQ